MIDWFNFSGFYSFLYIIFILLSVVYVFDYASNNSSSSNCNADENSECDEDNDENSDCDEDDSITIKIKKEDLDKTVCAIKKLKKDMKNVC